MVLIARARLEAGHSGAQSRVKCGYRSIVGHRRSVPDRVVGTCWQIRGYGLRHSNGNGAKTRVGGCVGNRLRIRIGSVVCDHRSVIRWGSIVRCGSIIGSDGHPDLIGCADRVGRDRNTDLIGPLLSRLTSIDQGIHERACAGSFAVSAKSQAATCNPTR